VNEVERLRALLERAADMLGDPDSSGYDRTRLAHEIRDELIEGLGRSTER
jgi:hypothetical protein